MLLLACSLMAPGNLFTRRQDLECFLCTKLLLLCDKIVIAGLSALGQLSTTFTWIVFKVFQIVKTLKVLVTLILNCPRGRDCIKKNNNNKIILHGPGGGTADTTIPHLLCSSIRTI